MPLNLWKPKAAPKMCKKASSKITDWRDLTQLQLRALCKLRNIKYHCHRKPSLLKHIEASVVGDPVTEEQLRCAIATAADKALTAKANKAAAAKAADKALTAKANKAAAAKAADKAAAAPTARTTSFRVEPMQELKRLLPQNVSVTVILQLLKKHCQESTPVKTMSKELEALLGRNWRVILRTLRSAFPKKPENV